MREERGDIDSLNHHVFSQTRKFYYLILPREEPRDEVGAPLGNGGASFEAPSLRRGGIAGASN